MSCFSSSISSLPTFTILCLLINGVNEVLFGLVPYGHIFRIHLPVFKEEFEKQEALLGCHPDWLFQGILSSLYGLKLGK